MNTKRHKFQQYPNIALSGKMGAGKTSIADYLVREYNYKLLHFAGPIKESASLIFGADVAHHNRGLLQKFGLLMRDEFDPNVWVDCMRRAIQTHDSYEPLIIDDCRFPNEQAMLNEVPGWRFVFVSSNVEDRFTRLQRIKKIEDREQMTHESEKAMDTMNYDHFVINDGTINDLYEKGDKLVEKWARRA